MTIREVNTADITHTVAALFYRANFHLDEGVLGVLQDATTKEESVAAREALEQIIQNASLASRGEVPLCQDCGTAVVFLEVGQDVHIAGGDLTDAINRGVAQAYSEGYLRKSMVTPPFSARINTGDNTPAVIHTEIVPGNRLKITAVPKGGGAENMSRLVMLTPSAGRSGVIDVAVTTVDEAGSNPCPPVIVGVGIGGTAEKALLISKKALLRKVGTHHPDPEIASLETELLKRINALGIGPLGYGGRTTALAVHVETFPAHIASLPVAVTLSCHSSRHEEAVL
jgi:fumarate hydratase subunit alpha